VSSALLLKRRPLSGFWVELKELAQHRELLLLLVEKDLKVRYRGTVLGVFWSLLNPFLLMAVYAAVFTFIARFSIERYPVFVLSGLLPWTTFAGAVTAGTVSILVNANLVRRFPFPTEVLPLTAVLSNLVNLLPGLVLLVPLVYITGGHLGWSLLIVPVLLLLQCALTGGIVLALAGLTVYFRDVQHLVGVALTVWFFATPILYPLDFLHGNALYQALQWNPMTWLATAYQQVFHDGVWPSPRYLAALTAISLLSLALGSLIFRRLQYRFAEEV
jgi:ABC-type polysaccharide/polyol phosphate export permease